MKRFLIKFAFQNISVSNSVAKYINTSSKIIHNCYDEEIFRVFEDEPRVYDFVFLGRIVSQKGCELLIRACKNLTEDFTLNIIGDGPERPRIEKIIKDFGLQKKIKLLGVIQGEELARMLNRHKVMVIPSVGQEGFGIVALEGMACACKVVAADAGGLSEAVKTFGKLFKMGDQKELECVLNEILYESKQEGFNTITNELKTFLMEQTKEKVAHKYLSYFQ